MVLKPMTPQELLPEHLQKSSEVQIESEKEREKKSMSAVHKSVSESHKRNERNKKKMEGNNLIMLATKSEMRDVRNNPSQVLVVLVYKETLISANNITSLPSVISHLLQDYKDVIPEEIPAGLPHCEALNIKLISYLELHYPIVHHTAPILKKQRKFKGKYKHF